MFQIDANGAKYNFSYLILAFTKKFLFPKIINSQQASNTS